MVVPTIDSGDGDLNCICGTVKLNRGGRGGARGAGACGAGARGVLFNSRSKTSPIKVVLRRSSTGFGGAFASFPVGLSRNLLAVQA